jgi:hypothetical protein
MATSDLIIGAVNPAGPLIRCILLGNAAYSRHGGTSASASAGAGGWQIVDRARQKAATEWLDYSPLAMTIKAMLNGETPGRGPLSVEPQITVLESYEMPVAGSTPPQPTTIQVSGPVPHNEIVWVCSKLDFDGGDAGAIRDPSTGQRTQQSFSIELTEYSPSIIVASALSPAEQAAEAAYQATLASVNS